MNEVYVPRYGQWAKLYKAHRFKEEDMDKADDIVFHNAAKSRTWRVGLLVNEEASILEDVSVSVRRACINFPLAVGYFFFTLMQSISAPVTADSASAYSAMVSDAPTLSGVIRSGSPQNTQCSFTISATRYLISDIFSFCGIASSDP